MKCAFKTKIFAWFIGSRAWGIFSTPGTICWQSVNPLDPGLLGITASPTEPAGAVDPIGDIIIDHILAFNGSTQLF